ncbi:hypothetical protein EVAR_84055_1 [Eumeta japonica]|uniref:Uncharacterized protein n=1 Tax=Eumeta variegata TaxID=151549 RepID=A0A4C1ZZM5_EUMVA|nr:hypothetical protein EVAR_84055_1 [Eumeta japonica]
MGLGASLQREVKARVREVKNDNWSDLMEEIISTHKAYWAVAKALKFDVCVAVARVLCSMFWLGCRAGITIRPVVETGRALSRVETPQLHPKRQGSSPCLWADNSG